MKFAGFRAYCEAPRSASDSLSASVLYAASQRGVHDSVCNELNVVIVGDLNISNINWSKYTGKGNIAKSLLTFVNNLGLKQLVQQATCN